PGRRSSKPPAGPKPRVHNGKDISLQRFRQVPRGRAMTRRRLANRRHSETFAVEAQGMKFTAISRFSDGSLTEIFLSNHRAGSDADASACDSAVVCSIGLQHGVPLETIRKALMRDGRGRARTPLGMTLDMIAECGS